MTALLWSESLKLRSLRSTWVVAAVAGVLSAVIGVAQVDALEEGAALPSLARVALAPAQAVWFLVIVLAVLAAAGEFQHRTVRTTLLATPRRLPVLVAKAGVAGVAGGLLAVLGTTCALAGAVVAGAAAGTSPSAGSAGDWGSAAAAVGLAAVWGVLATGLGVLTRSTAAAVTTVLLWRFVGEGLLPPLTGHDIRRWTPSGAADALVGLGGSAVLPVPAAAALLLALVAAVTAAAGVLFCRTDPA